ncbi:MAG: YfhO family protein [Lachnospiraceae bacterium]|nr:YfhO family protein [Lachnospiraceae bacterium]
MLITAFSLGFVLYIVCVLPLIIKHGGLFFYYGDYNVQQVPFYILAHRAVRNGELFWNWNLDLGGSMIGDFAFYLFGSPFFWLTIPFPENSIPYIMPFIMALKFGIAMLTSTLYFRRYVRQPLPLLTGALLYTFSGFQACNIVFQHFADVIAFFPLLLLTFDDLMAFDKGKNGEPFELSGGRFVRFSLTVALMSVINYYFFFGQILFLILYFLVRYVRGNPRNVIITRFVRALAGGALGLMLAGFFLAQAYFGVSGNARISQVLTGYEVLVYESMKLPYAILKSLAMIPDIIGKGTLFYTGAIRNSSLAAYLPMFGISGVVAFFVSKKGRRDWRKTLLIICAVIAMVPFLNAAFSLFNKQYYARWFYLPLTFMAVITAQEIERGRDREWKIGVISSLGLFMFMLCVALLPSTNSNGELVYLNMTDNSDLFWRQVKGTAFMSALIVTIIYFVNRRKIRKILLFAGTVLCCFISTYVVLINGASLINDFGMTEWKKQMLDSRPELSGEGFYRIETDSTSTNYEMAWGIPTIHCFLSTIPAEIFDFYEGAADINRGVESDPPLDREGLRAILSVQYYLENAVINDSGEFSQNRGIPGYYAVDYQNDFAIYRNTNYIPMGFTFDNYVRRSDFDLLDKADADQLLVRAIILDDEDADGFDDILEELPDAEYSMIMSDDYFAMECARRRESACTSFEPDTRGFSATTSDLPAENLVFFSVPASKGFTAKVDGKKTQIIKADYGLMAVRVPAGVHEIRVNYRPAGRTGGIILEVFAIMLLAAYIFMYRLNNSSNGIQLSSGRRSLMALDTVNKKSTEEIE